MFALDIHGIHMLEAITWCPRARINCIQWNRATPWFLYTDLVVYQDKWIESTGDGSENVC
jgi:hypothetical protein